MNAVGVRIDDRASRALQARIDGVRWYHEFDFPNGLRARKPAADPDVAGHRLLWRFIELELDKLDLAGKSVLDIGCWDGYWSFYAERRGARRVLATDDTAENWGCGDGLRLARELFGSRIETRLDVSVYGLDRVHECFDVIFFLGVYYHLIDPFCAFAQIRHRCRDTTIVVIEGDVSTGLRQHTVQVDFADRSLPIFLPSPESLDDLLRAAYLAPVKRALLFPPHDRPDGRPSLPPGMNRAVTICRPFCAANTAHRARPPFGLSRYDPRFSPRWRRRLSAGWRALRASSPAPKPPSSG